MIKNLQQGSNHGADGYGNAPKKIGLVFLLVTKKTRRKAME
jgi:hypothetical protein